MPGDVGDRLAEHGQQLRAERRRHHGVDRPGGADDRGEPQHRDVLLDQAADAGAQRVAARSWSSKIVPRIALIVSSRSATDLSSRSATAPSPVIAADALEPQAGGEEPLDDDVVEVAGDPLAVGDHRELLAVGERLGAVERQRDLVGEAGEEVAVLHVEQARAGVGDGDQRGDRREVRAQRAPRRAVRRRRVGERRRAGPGSVPRVGQGGSDVPGRPRPARR